MPPEFAPRPTTHKIGLAGAAPAAPVASGKIVSDNEYGNKIILVAAKIEQNAVIIRDMRESFAKVEADYVAMKALRDEEFAKLDKAEKDFGELRSMLNQATAALLTGATFDPRSGSVGIAGNNTNPHKRR